MGNVLVNPSLGATLTVNPTLGQTQKLYSGGSNTVLKYLPSGGPTPTQITDLSGHGNDAAFTDAPAIVQINGRNCYQFVSADTNYCTVPDLPELLGATAATWLAYVRKDAYIQYQGVANDYVAANSERKWHFGFETAENSWQGWVGNGTAYTSIAQAGVFTAGWHFVWVRFTGNNATGLEAGCDSSVAMSVSTTTVAALGAVGQGHTYVGRWDTFYSSQTLGALAIWASTGDTTGAISDAEIAKWRWDMKARLGL